MGFDDAVKREKSRRKGIVTPSSTGPEIGGASRTDKKTGKTPPPVKETNWDREFGDIPTAESEHYLDFGTNAGNQVFMNSLNGQYKYHITQKKEMSYNEGDETSIGYQSKQLGETSWALAKLVKKGIKTNADLKQYNSLRKTWDTAANGLITNVGASGSNYGVGFDDDMKLVDPKDVPKDSEQTIVYDTYGTTIQQKVETDWNPFSVGLKAILLKAKNPTGDAFTMMAQTGGFLNTSQVKDKKSVYKKLTTYDGSMRDLVTSANKPVISQWMDIGFANFKNDKFDSESDALSNKERVVAASQTALNHISKYGNKNKGLATKILKDIEAKLSEFAKEPGGADNLDVKRQQLYKDNEVEIKRLVNEMGYYGTNKLINKYESSFSSPNYFPGKTEEEKIENMMYFTNVITVARDQKNNYDETSLKYKKKAYGDLEADLSSDIDKMVYSYMKDSSGDFSGVVPEWSEVKRAMDRGQGSYLDRDKRRYPLVAGQDSKDMNSLKTPLSGKSFEKKQDPTYTEVKEAYYRNLWKYKRKFNDLNADEVFDESLMTLGLGLERAQHVGHEDIDFRKESGKNRNAHTIRNMISEGLSTGSVYAYEGGFSKTITEAGLENVPNETREKMFDDLFNGKTPTNYDVKFSRDTPVPNRSSYSFTTRGSKPKSFTFYVKTDDALDAGEKYAVRTNTSAPEYSYQSQGGWDMSAYDALYEHIEKPRIKTIGGMKYLVANALDPETNLADETRVLLGPDKTISIEKAVEMAKGILKDSDTQISEYLNLYGE